MAIDVWLRCWGGADACPTVGNITRRGGTEIVFIISIGAVLLVAR